MKLFNGETKAVFDTNGSIKFFNINAGSETTGRQTPASLLGESGVFRPDSTRRFIPAPPVDLYLSNTTLNGTYEVRRFRRIYEILRTTNSITVENNVTVGGPTLLKAGNTINLKPGFTAQSGIDFTAKIETVPNVAKRFYYLKDHLGSIRVVVDEPGNIVSSDDYDSVRNLSTLEE